MSFLNHSDLYFSLPDGNGLFFFCFSWLNPLLQLGQHRLEKGDMYSVLPEDRSETLGEELQRCWNEEVKKASKELWKPQLSRVLIKCYGKSYALAGLFEFFLVCCEYLQLAPVLKQSFMHRSYLRFCAVFWPYYFR
uniref:Uncharacterized protein n=1 Tax=Maylandia zebra TaxID=106582 RepID=A0A3P9ATT6_9CICH